MATIASFPCPDHWVEWVRPWSYQHHHHTVPVEHNTRSAQYCRRTLVYQTMPRDDRSRFLCIMNVESEINQILCMLESIP